MSLFEIHDLQARIQDTPILRGVNLNIEEGQVIALMGPNGSGKSTLAHVLMGHPDYIVDSGSVFLRGVDLLSLKPEERARQGLFLSFQYPQTIAGVTVGNFLRLAYSATVGYSVSVQEFMPLLKQKMDALTIPYTFITRSVNEGFSGGEKKRFEILQLSLLEPRLAILDETDSGLDVDAMRAIGEALLLIRQQHPTMSLLVITHYQRFLDYVPIDEVAVMKAGLVIRQGDASLVRAIQESGYDHL